MTKDDLGPMPEPITQDPELVPGGIDALIEDPADDVLGRDLEPEDNPVDDAMPDELSEPDKKSQSPDGEAAEGIGTAPGPDVNESSGDGPPAGQEAEDGSVEPPA